MIRVIHGGQLLTGEDEFLIQEHSGHTPDLIDDIEEKLTDYEASLLDQGDWVMVIDGCAHLIECGDHPEYIRVTGDVNWDILNFGGEADELIVLHTESNSDEGWITIADGDVVEEGTFHPFLIDA